MMPTMVGSGRGNPLDWEAQRPLGRVGLGRRRLGRFGGSLSSGVGGLTMAIEGEGGLPKWLRERKREEIVWDGGLRVVTTLC